MAPKLRMVATNISTWLNLSWVILTKLIYADKTFIGYFPTGPDSLKSKVTFTYTYIRHLKGEDKGTMIVVL